MSLHEGYLNKLAFNSTEPIVIVGDNKGKIHSLKLSPNLRKRTKEAQVALNENDFKLLKKLEVQKLKKILSQVVQTDIND